MADKAKHAFGSEKNIQSALDAGKINEYDILFLDEKKVGWVNKDGEVVIAEPDLSGIEAKIATKADVDALSDVEAAAKVYTDGKVEAAIKEHLVKKYAIEDVPDGSLVDYRDGEIRILCKNDAEFVKQSVGTGGDPNCYYVTLKTYVFDDNVVGYREHLGGQSDSETLIDLKTDGYGRRYQPTWLAVAKYDDTTGWTYYGKNSSTEKYVGWDYQIDWYDANNEIIGSDTVRINLSNEECHFVNKPYYVGSMMKEVDTKIDTKIKEKIAEVEGAIEIVEF